MDEKSILRDYQDLSDVSDKNSDIMSSMLLDEKLREKGLGSLEENIAALARARLSMPIFRNLYQAAADNRNLTPENAALQILKGYIAATLEDYEPEEQKAILMEMCEEMSEAYQPSCQMGSDAMGGAQRVPLERYDTEELKMKLAREILKYCKENFSIKAVDADGWDHETVENQEGYAYSAGAAAASVYLNDENLRESPENIGLMAGVTDGFANAVKDDRTERTAELIAVMLFAVAVCSLYCYLLEIVALPALDVAGQFFAGETLSWAAIKAAVTEVLSDVGIFLKIALGSAGGALAAEGIAHIQDKLEDDTQSAVAEQSKLYEGKAHWELEEDDYDEYDEESDEEYEENAYT